MMSKRSLVSTRDLSGLPTIVALRKRMQALAAIESIVAIEYDLPQFEYHPDWDTAEQMGAFKNGSGDHLFAHFTDSGCCILGFAHESVMSPFRKRPPQLWPGLFGSVPAEFSESVKEPAFDADSTTFVLWRRKSSRKWQADEVEYPDDGLEDGSSTLLAPLLWTAREFANWLDDEYELEVDVAVVEAAFQYRALTSEQLMQLNPDADISELREAALETGYPLR